MATGHFRSYVWDPVLIVSQIVSLQCTFYLFLGIWIFFLDFCTSSTRSLDQIFEYQELDISSLKGKITMSAFCLNALTGAAALWVIVRRSKQCLDFAATAHVFHLLFCSIYGGFPATWSWWLINLACMALMVVIGEFACMRTELRAIPVSVMSVKSSV